MRFRKPSGGRLLLAAAASLLTLVATMPAASAASSANWQLANGSVKTTPGIATFDFTAGNKARLLYSSRNTTLLGDLNNKTITAAYDIEGATGAFTYYGETAGSLPGAQVRLYFESIPSGSKFAYTNYWWADVTPGSAVLANGQVTLTITVDPAQAWSDWNGQHSATNGPAFISAASNVTSVGLSFGGGNFFENGAGTSDGSGTFTLNTFTDK